MPRGRRDPLLVARSGLAMMAPAPPAAAADDPVALPADVEQLQLRHGIEGLCKTYLDSRGRRKDGMRLPCIIVFDRDGRLLGGQGGFRSGDLRGLRRIVHGGKPFRFAASLDDTLAEIDTAAGAPATSVPRPDADFHVVVHRSAQCPRCDRLDHELRIVLAGLHRHRFAWYAVDSDPARLPASP